MFPSRPSSAKKVRVIKIVHISQLKSLKNVSSEMINSSENSIDVQIRPRKPIQSLNINQLISNEQRINQWNNSEEEENLSITLNKNMMKKPIQMISSSNLFNENHLNNWIKSKFNQRSTIGDLNHPMFDSNKRRKKQIKSICSSTLLCKLLILFFILFILTIIGIISFFFLIKSQRTTSLESFDSFSLLLNTSTTSTTTTSSMICSLSCLNESWISSLSLLAKWTFDRSYFDQTNHFNLIGINNPSFISSGYINEAIWFNSNEYLYSSYIPLSSESFTIELWIYPSGYPNPLDHSILGLCSNPSNNQCLHITIRKINSNYYFYFAFFGDNCLSIETVSLFQWTHVAFVFDLNGYSMIIYINGIFDHMCTSATPLLATNTSTPLTIGYIPGIVSAYGNNFFQGYIDHLIISNRSKSSCEILEDASLVAYFPFNNGSLFLDYGPNGLQITEQFVSLVLLGHALQGIHLINSSSFIQISDLTALGIINQSFSISLWIYPNSLQGILLFLSDNLLGTQWSLPMMGFATNTSLVAQIFDNEVISILDPSPLILSFWSHLVFTYSSTNGIRLYRNNILVAFLSSSRSYRASSNPNYLTLGNTPQSSGTCSDGLIPLRTIFDGNIDELKIYNRELTIDDVCALYRK